MPYNRRDFLGLFAAGILTAAIAPTAIAASIDKRKIKALAFDAFPIFDPRIVFKKVEQLFPGKGDDITKIWRTRQFEYQWLRAFEGDYANFEKTTIDALVFATKSLRVNITEEQKTALIDAYGQLDIWPDVRPALEAFKKQGLELVFLSNMTEQLLKKNIEHNNLNDLFSAVISTDSIRSYKPASEAYQLGVKHLKLKKDEIGFVAFAGWDAVGAKTFGYPTYWVNRMNQPAEELGNEADWTGKDLKALQTYLSTQ